MTRYVPLWKPIETVEEHDIYVDTWSHSQPRRVTASTPPAAAGQPHRIEFVVSPNTGQTSSRFESPGTLIQTLVPEAHLAAGHEIRRAYRDAAYLDVRRVLGELAGIDPDRLADGDSIAEHIRTVMEHVLREDGRGIDDSPLTAEGRRALRDVLTQVLQP